MCVCVPVCVCVLCVQELGMKNMLHRKKLQLALQAMGGEQDSRLCDLDHNFVTRKSEGHITL